MWKNLIRFMRLMGDRLPVYLGAILLSTAGDAGRRIANSCLIRHIVTAAQTGDAQGLFPFVTGCLAAFVLGLLLWRFGIIHYNIEGRTGAGRVEKLVFSKAMRLPMSFYEENHSGVFLSMLIFDVQKASDIYTSRLRRLLSAALSVAIYLIPMLYFSRELTLWLAAVSLLAFAANIFFAGPMERLGELLSDRNSEMLERLTDILSGMELIKIFPAGPRLWREYRAAGREYFRAQKRANRLSAGLECQSCLFELAGSLAFLGLGIWFVSLGRIGLGELTALYALYGSFHSSFLEIGRYLPELTCCLANVEKIFEFLDREEEPERWKYETCAESVSQKGVCGETALSVRNLSFAYGGDSRILENFSMEVRRGSFTALTGRSGCGKSTLAKLLLGFYPPERGSLSIGGREYAGLALREIREKITYVPQEPYLYQTSIAKNIACGRPGAGRDEIIAAARAANAHEFIMRLPRGYDTVLGECGNTLSGGERQRIAIARAVLRKAPLILLDEATSALDNESEALVLEAVRALKGEHTILMIAHRPAAVAAADTVIRVGE